MCDLRGKRLVVHEEQLELANVAHDELFKAAREEMACLGSDLRNGLTVRREDEPFCCCHNRSIGER